MEPWTNAVSTAGTFCLLGDADFQELLLCASAAAFKLLLIHRRESRRASADFCQLLHDNWHLQRPPRRRGDDSPKIQILGNYLLPHFDPLLCR